MDQVTQQNTALVEESAAAAESLKGQATALVQAVAVFRLARDAQTMAAAAGDGWNGAERRGPQRSKNVARLAFGAKKASADAEAPVLTEETRPAARTGTDDGEWRSFRRRAGAPEPSADGGSARIW